MARISYFLSAALFALASCSYKPPYSAPVESTDQTPTRNMGGPWLDYDNAFPAPPIGPLEDIIPNEYTPKDNSATRLEMQMQLYEGESVVEIPIFVYDKSNPELSKFDGLNYDLEGLNDSIERDVKQFYEYNKSGSLQIRTYPFINDNYLQAAVVCKADPSDASTGDINTLNFDIYYNKAITVIELLESKNLTVEFAVQAMANAYFPENPGESLSGAECAGFLFAQGPGADQIALLFEADISVPEAGLRRDFYQYILEAGELAKLDLDSPFPVDALAQMTPPLAYAR